MLQVHLWAGYVVSYIILRLSGNVGWHQHQHNFGENGIRKQGLSKDSLML